MLDALKASDSLAPLTSGPAELPAWARNQPVPKTLEEAGFQSGAALGAVNWIASANLTEPPARLWRQRQALKAAASIVRLQGRREDLATLRDNWYLRAPQDAPGPAGRVLEVWRRLGERRSLRGGDRIEEIAAGLDVPMGMDLKEIFEQSNDRQISAVRAAATIASKVAACRPKAPALALWLADAVLADRLNWASPVALLSGQVSRRDVLSAPMFLQGDEAWLLRCHIAYGKAAAEAFDLAQDLERRANMLRAIGPKLRSKGAGRALELLLREDAFAPGSKQAGLSDRSARRLCERLVFLGGVRELTGRTTFRLYGL